MLRGIVICPDEELSDRITEALRTTGMIRVSRTVARYPSEDEMTRLCRATPADVIFLSVEQIDRASRIAALVQAQLPNAQIAGLGRTEDPNLSTSDFTSRGIPRLLPFPFEPRHVSDLLTRVKESLDREPVQIAATDLVYSFLPSKPGVGASTLVSNLAIAAGRVTAERTLLMDCDRHNGIVRFMLQLERKLSLVDAVRHAYELDESIWPQLVTPMDNVDVMHSGSVDSEQRIEPAHIHQILDFARRNYDAVFLDLSGSFEGFSVAAMEGSKRIFLVVTPELASLHMAREKLKYLTRLDLVERTSVVVNRAQKKSIISKQQIEEILKAPVHASFMNDYQRVNFALTAGKAIDPQSELGMQIATLAGAIADKSRNGSEHRARLTDYFSLSTAKSLFG